MTVDDWSRPLVTNTGKPARVVEGPDSNEERWIEAKWDEARFPGRTYKQCLYRDGTLGIGRYSIRNATPAEVLTHPDVWPEWQDWARQLQVQADVAQAVRDFVSQPEGDWLTPETAIGARLPCGATVVSAEWLGHLCFNRRVVTVDFDKAPKGRLAQSGWLFFTDGVNYRNVIADLTPPVAAPQPEGVYVTRQMLAPVVQALTNATKRLCVHPTETNDAKQLVINCDKGLAHVVRALEAIDALGIPPAPAAEPQPEGVWVTREALFAAIVSVGGLYAKPMYALADALGMPPAPPKVAPSEAAYEAWVNSLPDVYPRSAWQAAWAACEQHYNIIGEDA